jgi:MerR family copper efflux transcriptional regulator
LAKTTDVSIDTLRHYEREGLLPVPPRRTSGYREYDLNAVQRVRFIKRAKGLGFSLEEVSDLLALAHDRERGVEGVKRRASERLADINQRIAQLSAMRDELARLVDACPGSGEPECCPILNRMQGGRAVEAPSGSHPGGTAVARAQSQSEGCCAGRAAVHASAPA